LGKADIKRSGSRVTVIATALMVHRSLSVAAKLAQQSIEVEVIDPRTLVPLDEETLSASIRKTHRVVIVSEDVSRAGVSAELAAWASGNLFDYLDAPVKCVAAKNTPIPFAPASEKAVIPQEEDITQAILQVLSDQ